MMHDPNNGLMSRRVLVMRLQLEYTDEDLYPAEVSRQVDWGNKSCVDWRRCN